MPASPKLMSTAIHPSFQGCVRPSSNGIPFARTSVLFGLLPSLSATRINQAEFLKSSGMRGVSGDRRRVRHRLAVGQIALLVILLTGTGLLLRSYANELSVPTGFSATTVTASVQMSSQYGNAHKRRATFGSLIERMKSVPGVQAVGV